MRIVALLLIGALLLSACGPATPTAADEMTESGQRFLLALPRLVIDVDDNGELSLGGVSLKDLEGLIPGFQVPEMGINPYYVDWMKLTDTQHVELVHTDNGIFAYVNGELMPYLAFDADSLGNVAGFGGLLGPQYGKLISMLVPIIQRTGLNVVLRFPTNGGMAEIPLRDPNMVPEPVVAEPSDPDAVLRVDVDYMADANGTGVPMLAGISSRDLLESTGFALPVELAPETMALIKALGVEDLRIVSNGTGMFLEVNGNALPHVAWSDAQLGSAAGLYGQINPESPYIELVNLLVPGLAGMDIDMLVRFHS
jgi:hypothetical protein